MGKVVGIISGKGGVGKTTVAINLGVAMAHHLKRSVTLIDCNVTTAHLGLHLGMYNHNITLNHVLRDENNIEDAVYSHFSGIKVIPASLSPKDLHGVDIVKLKDKIKGIAHTNDMIILDAGPGLGREAVGAIKACDELIYVTNPNVPAVMDIVRCQEVASELGAKPLGIVLNMFNKDKYEMSVKEIEYITGLQVIGKIPYDKNVSKSLAMKLPVVYYRPKAQVSRSFVRLASRIMNQEPFMERSFLDSLRSAFSFHKSAAAYD